MHGVVMEEEIQDKTEAIKNNSFQVTMLIGGAVIAVLAQWVRGFAYLELRWVTNIFFVIGIALFLFGAWTIDNNRMPKWVEKGVNGVSGWFHISPTRLIYLFFSICLVVIATLADGYEAKMLNPLAAMFCWAGAIFLVIAAAWEQKLQKITISRPTLIWFLAIFLVALALRIFNMTYIPVVLSGDEASSGLHTVNFLKGYTNNPFNVGWFSFPSLYFLVQSVGIIILGQTTAGLRITAVIAGALTVATLYLAVRAMFGQRTALIAAADPGLFTFSYQFQPDRTQQHLGRIGVCRRDRSPLVGVESGTAGSVPSLRPGDGFRPVFLYNLPRNYSSRIHLAYSGCHSGLEEIQAYAAKYPDHVYQCIYRCTAIGLVLHQTSK